MVKPALDPETGLSRYRPAGLGIPPETEASHFTHILQPFAQRRGISVNEYIDGYNDGSIPEPELDDYFMHDRGVRESGHDTSYRLDKKAADLATVDLNSLLYKVSLLAHRRLLKCSTRLILLKPYNSSSMMNCYWTKSLNFRRGQSSLRSLQKVLPGNPQRRSRCRVASGMSELPLAKQRWTGCAGTTVSACILTTTPRQRSKRDTNL